jgi:hypothetical protein
VIEGLRSLPWLQERIRNDRNVVEYLIDCDKCMASTEQAERQAMGCGWEPRDQNARPWTHQGYTDADPTTCPGYTTKLPEVIEINYARMHAKNNMAEHFMPGGATENVMRGIAILEGAVNEANCWRPEDKK